MEITEAEKQKKYRTIAKFCERNNIQEAKVLLFDGTIITWKSRIRSLK